MSNRLEALTGVRRLAAAGRLSHAYLITGPQGSGKHEVALELAKALLCQGEDKPCGACPHCKKIAAGVHPDLITITPGEGKRDILVDQIRALRSDVYVRPNEGLRKVYLIDPASSMNASAQNALLKVLEEGPAYAAFLLLSDTAGSMLTTIRSRCEQVTLTPPLEKASALGEEAQALAHALLHEREYQLMTRCVALEKLEREGLLTLFEETIQALEREMRRDPVLRCKAMEQMERLKALRAAGQFNVGTGHLAGWLCAGNY